MTDIDIDIFAAEVASRVIPEDCGWRITNIPEPGVISEKRRRICIAEALRDAQERRVTRTKGQHVRTALSAI